MTNNNPTNLEIVRQACIKGNSHWREMRKILGRPITLADVLLALGRSIYCTIDQNNPSFFLIMNKESTHPRAEWDLTKPLEGQSEDTLNFLAQLHDDKGLCDEGPERSSCQKSESPATKMAGETWEDIHEYHHSGEVGKCNCMVNGKTCTKPGNTHNCHCHPIKCKGCHGCSTIAKSPATTAKCPVCGGKYCEGETCLTHNASKISVTRKLCDSKPSLPGIENSRNPGELEDWKKGFKQLFPLLADAHTWHYANLEIRKNGKNITREADSLHGIENFISTLLQQERERAANIIKEVYGRPYPDLEYCGIRHFSEYTIARIYELILFDNQ